MFLGLLHHPKTDTKFVLITQMLGHRPAGSSPIQRRGEADSSSPSACRGLLDCGAKPRGFDA
jgi:hypothetical protein